MEAPTGASIDEASLRENALGLWHDLRGLAYDHLQLAALEAQRAGRSLVWMLAASIVLGVLLATTPLILSGALILSLMTLGLAPGAALLLAALTNVALAIALAMAIRARSRLLGFPASLRSLKPAPRPDAVGSPAP